MAEIVDTLDQAVIAGAEMGLPIYTPTQRFISFSVVGGLLIWYFKPDFAFYDEVTGPKSLAVTPGKYQGTVVKRVPRPWSVTNTKNLPHETIFPWYLAAMVPGVAMSYFI